MALQAVCEVCLHACSPVEGHLSIRRARRAAGGMVTDNNYGRITSLALDPIEKSPSPSLCPTLWCFRLAHTIATFVALSAKTPLLPALALTTSLGGKLPRNS